MAERFHEVRRNRGARKYWGVERVVEHYINTTVVGKENIGEMRRLLVDDVPLIIVSNHLSHADAPVINTEIKREAPEIERKLVYLVGTALEKNLFTRTAQPYEAIIVQSLRLKPEKAPPGVWEERERLTQLAFQATKETFMQRKVPVLFPQGTRLEGAIDRVYYKTAYYLNLVEGIHVVPVAVHGTEIVLPPRKRKPIHGDVTLNIGKPVPVQEFKGRVGEPSSEDDFHQKLVDEVMFEVAALIPPKYRGYYALPRSS